MITTRAQRRQQQQLHDKKGEEVEAAPNGLVRLVEDPEVEKREMVQLWSITYTLPKLPQSHTHFCRKGPTGYSPATERLAAN